jgi:hypothetical protein
VDIQWIALTDSTDGCWDSFLRFESRILHGKPDPDMGLFHDAVNREGCCVLKNSVTCGKRSRACWVGKGRERGHVAGWLDGLQIRAWPPRKKLVSLRG